jgi:hypothetical protein
MNTKLSAQLDEFKAPAISGAGSPVAVAAIVAIIRIIIK